VLDISNYKEAYTFKFSDGDILINATQCAQINSDHYAVAPIVTTIEVHSFFLSFLSCIFTFGVGFK
jgi:hypothetical protein